MYLAAAYLRMYVAVQGWCFELKCSQFEQENEFEHDSDREMKWAWKNLDKEVNLMSWKWNRSDLDMNRKWMEMVYRTLLKSECVQLDVH